MTHQLSSFHTDSLQIEPKRKKPDEATIEVRATWTVCRIKNDLLKSMQPLSQNSKSCEELHVFFLPKGFSRRAIFLWIRSNATINLPMVFEEQKLFSIKFHLTSVMLLQFCCATSTSGVTVVVNNGEVKRYAEYLLFRYQEKKLRPRNDIFISKNLCRIE